MASVEVRCECVDRVEHSNVLVEDSGQSINFRNAEKNVYLRIRVDGCVVMNGRRADYVLEEGQNAIVIELKKGSVEDGAEQVIATAKLWKQLGRSSNICGLIVGKRYPKAGAASGIQVRQRRFQKEFGKPLHVVNNAPTVTFANIFRFRGHLSP